MIRLPRAVHQLLQIQSPSKVLLGTAEPIPRWVAMAWAAGDALASLAWGALGVLCAVAPIAVPVALVWLLLR